MSTGSAGPLIPRRRLGAAFRDLREARGETLQQTAKALMFSPSKLSRIENGLAGEPHPRDVRDLITHFGLDGSPDAAALDTLATAGRVAGWWQVPPYDMPSRLDTFISYENAADSVESYIPTVVPAHLQIRQYAVETLRRLAPNLSTAEIEQQAALRMERQRALSERTTPPRILLLAPETVLRRSVGDSTTMRAQLDCIVTSYESGGIDFRVIPFTAGLHPAMEGSFTIFGFRNPVDPDIVALDTVSSTQFVDQPTIVREHQLVLRDLTDHSLSRDDSRALVVALRDGPDIWSAV